MALHKDYFLCEDDLDCVLTITDADLFGNDEDMESEITTCIKSLPSSKIALSNASFVQNFVYPKQVYQGARR